MLARCARATAAVSKRCGPQAAPAEEFRVGAGRRSLRRPPTGGGPVQERGSRYGDKPALFAGNREIAHLEAPGVIDLRITRAAWSRASAEFAADPAVRRDRSRRDWIEVRLHSASDLDRLSGLLATAMAENA
jgi:hypothetical protein